MKKRVLSATLAIAMLASSVGAMNVFAAADRDDGFKAYTAKEAVNVGNVNLDLTDIYTGTYEDAMDEGLSDDYYYLFDYKVKDQDKVDHDDVVDAIDAAIADDDIMVGENTTETHKIRFSALINFIRNHSVIKNAFVQKDDAGTANGYVPLNSNSKIDSQYLSFGKTAGTIYDGGNGATLETSLSSHKNDKTNPHAVTKAQVGLGNVNNTADNAKNVLSATKLTTSRSINGTSFDGTKDITTAKWGTARTISLGGDVTGSASIDGSKNVTITATVSGDGQSGIISKLPSASTTTKRIVQLTDSTTSTSTSTAATANSVKQVKDYTDQKVASLIDGAPETLDTLKEVADAIHENEDVVDALNAAIGTKANQSALNTHTGNSTIHITAAERTSWNGAVEKIDSLVPISTEEIDTILAN